MHVEVLCEFPDRLGEEGVFEFDILSWWRELNGKEDCMPPEILRRFFLLGVLKPQARLLHTASPDIIFVLCDVGVDVNSKLPLSGQPTALHVAASSAEVEVLLQNHADPNAKDRDHNTPLHTFARHVFDHGAWQGDYVEMARAVISAGADPLAENRSGNTPLDLIPTMSIMMPPSLAEFVAILKEPPALEVLTKSAAKATI